MIGTPALPAAGVSMRIVVLKMAFPRVRKAAGASLSAARWAWRFPSSATEASSFRVPLDIFH
jgi:hypothetical protein